MNTLQCQHLDQAREPVKKSYSRPQLVIYGELREITNANSCNGSLDGLAGHCGPAGNPTAGIAKTAAP
jgi:hypothetical protein